MREASLSLEMICGHGMAFSSPGIRGGRDAEDAVAFLWGGWSGSKGGGGDVGKLVEEDGVLVASVSETGLG